VKNVVALVIRLEALTLNNRDINAMRCIRNKIAIKIDFRKHLKWDTVSLFLVSQMHFQVLIFWVNFLVSHKYQNVNACTKVFRNDSNDKKFNFMAWHKILTDNLESEKALRFFSKCLERSKPVFGQEFNVAVGRFIEWILWIKPRWYNNAIKRTKHQSAEKLNACW